MKNTTKDLNDKLFEQLERLDDIDEMDQSSFLKELKKADMVTKIANTIIKNAETAFKVEVFKQNVMEKNKFNANANKPVMPEFFISNKETVKEKQLRIIGGTIDGQTD